MVAQIIQIQVFQGKVSLSWECGIQNFNTTQDHLKMSIKSSIHLKTYWYIAAQHQTPIYE